MLHLSYLMEQTVFECTCFLNFWSLKLLIPLGFSPSAAELQFILQWEEEAATPW